MLADILIVEDEILIAMGIQEKLERFGYRVSGIAASAQEVLSKLLEHPPDLVLMDIVIEGNLDGVETAQKIREQFKIPVIYLTAYDDEKTLKRAQLTQPSAYLLKPFNDRELQITIELTLYKEQVRKKLENQEQWYAGILKCLGEAIITVDTEHTVLYINPAAEALLNRQAGDLTGRQLSEYCRLSSPKKEPLEIKDLLTRAFTKGIRIQKTNLQLFDTDSPMVLDISVAPIRGEGGVIRGGVLVFHDKSTVGQMLQKYEKGAEPTPRDLLTYRERQVLQHLVEGQATKQLADTLGISPRTVEFHRYNLMRKLRVEDIPSLVRRALSWDLVELE